VFGTLKSLALVAQDCERVADLVRQQFRLSAQVAVLVSELECQLPGCPPLVTVIAFWTAADRRHHYKVFKPVTCIEATDLPPWWMRDALIVANEFECGCC
jgi:nitrate reductase delta subunit